MAGERLIDDEIVAATGRGQGQVARAGVDRAGEREAVGVGQMEGIVGGGEGAQIGDGIGGAQRDGAMRGARQRRSRDLAPEFDSIRAAEVSVTTWPVSA